MSDDKSGSRLPPPAFPPGSRKHFGSNSNNSGAHAGESMGDGFISPDDPIPERRNTVDDAFISPDDPIPTRHLEAAGDALPEFEDEGGVVTSMSLDEHTDPEELATGGDPYVMELVHKVGKLAEALRKKGEAGLKTTPGMDKFEATLRGYCVGYLAGRRAEDDPSGADY